MNTFLRVTSLTLLTASISLSVSPSSKASFYPSITSDNNQMFRYALMQEESLEVIHAGGVKYWLDIDPRWPGVYYSSTVKDKCLYGGVEAGGGGYNCQITSLKNANLRAGVNYWLDIDPRWPGVYYSSKVKDTCPYGGVEAGGGGYNCLLVKYKSAPAIESTPAPVSTSSLISPETSGTVNGPNKEVSMGGGYAEAEATFYRNGLVVISTHSKSKSWSQGTKGSVFVVGLDTKGRALFVSPVFDIPTACSRADTCSSDRRDNVQHNVNAEVAKYIAKVDVYVQDRSGGRSAREAINNTIKESCATYNDLPASAKAGIAAETGFTGCGN
jgi:hypothetical protein